MGINYYSALELKRHCTEEDVHKAFGRLVFQCLTTNGVQHDLFAMCEAYEVLTDPFRRAVYEKYGEETLKTGILSASIAPWTYHGNVATTYSGYCERKNPISRLASIKKSKVIVPDVVRVRLPLTLDEVFYGSTKRVAVNSHSMRTSKSSGTQVVTVNVPRGFPAGGTLRTKVAGVENGQGIKTMYIFTTVDVPHKVFKREKNNLIVVQTVSLKQSWNGIRLKIKTLDNKAFRVNITQVITNDYVKIIRNEGMPDVNDPTVRGNIVIKFNVVYPLNPQIADQTLSGLCNDDSDNDI